MKHRIILSLLAAASISVPEIAFAGAWLNPKGKYELDNGAYYSFPSTSYDRGVLEGPPDVNYTIKSERSRFALTEEFSYGLTNRDTLLTIFDVGYERDKVTTTLSNNEQFTLKTDYFTIVPTLGYRRGLYEDTKQVVSLQTEFHPGEFIFSNNDNMYNKHLLSYSAALQYGRNFQTNFGLPQIFGNPVASGRYHYFELIGGVTHYPHLGQAEWNGEFHFGLSVTRNFTVVAGMYNNWNAASYDRIPVNDAEILSKVGATTLLAGQQTELIELLRDRSRSRSSYRDHQLDLKLEYDVKKNGVVFIEGISSIIKGKPFSGNALIIGYESKF